MKEVYAYGKSIGNVGFWLMVLLLFTSNATFEEHMANAPFLEGKYRLKSTGDFNDYLTGSINFESKVEKAADGTPFSILQLDLENTSENQDHSLGFLISQENNAQGIKVGTYEVPKTINGFLRYFDGIFGFANIKAVGEVPFFVRSGKITIYQINNITLHGYMDLSFQDLDGKSIKVKGNFKAVKK